MSDPSKEKIMEAARVLASLPDHWFEKSILITIKNAEEDSDRIMRRAGHNWKVMCRERFKAVMNAIAEKPYE